LDHDPTRLPDEGSPDWTADRLNLALAAAGLGDWSWNVQTDVVTCSARAAEIFGIPPAPRLTWTAMRQLLHPDDRETVRLAVLRAIESGGNYSVEYRLISGGRERWVAASGRGQYDEHGNVLGMLGVVQNVTNGRLLVRLDDAVRPLVKSEDITYMAASVLGQHLDVHRCAYAFVEEDQDTFSLTGNYTNGAPSIVGRYAFRQFGEECRRSMRAGLPYVVEDSLADERILAEDRPAYVLTTIRAVICVPILKLGRFVAAMAVHMQVPRSWTASEVELVQRVASRCWESIERSRVEREREALLEQAESANRAKDEFLAMLGHELRNPLAPILTALHLMRLQQNHTFERERTVIERQVKHLTRLVDDLLDVSRIARAKVILELERMELQEIVNAALEVASPLLEERAHRVIVEVPPHGLAIDGDAARLTQVVSNLLTNAAKYTPPGGCIRLRGGLEGESVVLSVQDDGMGMTAEVLPHVFDLFVQGRQTIERALGGLGLGLTIVRSLVERHGGDVTAHSAGRDRGSEFVVRLPRATPVAQPAAPATSERDSHHDAARGTRLLVVDDNVDAAEMLAAALTSRGCVVQVAYDAPAALQIAATRDFDAALLDIGLPVIDGYELAARLRALHTMRGARLIAITGYGQASDRQRALAAGFDHHLVKPVDLRALEQLLPRAAASPAGR
jgi:PAS domain S-box-containing protein